MKKLIYILIATTMMLSACSDEFLDVENKNNLDISSFFKTENDLQLAVNAAYTPLGHRGMFGLDYFIIFNTLDPYIWWENPLAGYDQMIINSNDFKDMWSDLYRGVFRTSDIMANMHRVKDVVNEQKLVQI